MKFNQTKLSLKNKKLIETFKEHLIEKGILNDGRNEEIIKEGINNRINSYISEKDFQNRGGGDLLGDKQSGDMTFKIADLKRDYNILKVAKDDVTNFIDKKEYLNNKLYLDIIDNIDLKN